VRRSILVRRDSGLGSYLIGKDVCRVLSTVEGISALVLDRQYIDRADLTYETNDARQDFDQIDRVLQASGMHRV
jgi:hypothetical protein